jgi:choline dehydrogenase
VQCSFTGRHTLYAVRGTRRITAKLANITEEEELPGKNTRAWGHHASCTCPIGSLERGGVLTSDLRVHGTQGLRVVNASVFPRTPGFFIVSAVYMVGEKGADVILASRGRS